LQARMGVPDRSEGVPGRRRRGGRCPGRPPTTTPKHASQSATRARRMLHRAAIIRSTRRSSKRRKLGSRSQQHRRSRRRVAEHSKPQARGCSRGAGRQWSCWGPAPQAESTRLSNNPRLHQNHGTNSCHPQLGIEVRQGSGTPLSTTEADHRRLHTRSRATRSSSTRARAGCRSRWGST